MAGEKSATVNHHLDRRPPREGLTAGLPGHGGEAPTHHQVGGAARCLSGSLCERGESQVKLVRPRAQIRQIR
jgi:hypothetical protein